jgi:hypothetical protein
MVQSLSNRYRHNNTFFWFIPQIWGNVLWLIVVTGDILFLETFYLPQGFSDITPTCFRTPYRVLYS